MTYTPEDYEALYGEHYIPKPWTIGRLMLLVLCIGFIFASWGIAGCDFKAAQATAEIKQTAIEKSEQLPPRAYFSHPLGTTWILQSGLDTNGDVIVDARRKHSMAGDLTERTTQ